MEGLVIRFKGKHYPKDMVLFAVFFYVGYAVSYQDLEESIEERGIDVDHATLNRWVIEYGPLLAEEAQKTQATDRLLVAHGRDVSEDQRTVDKSVSRGRQVRQNP